MHNLTEHSRSLMRLLQLRIYDPLAERQCIRQCARRSAPAVAIRLLFPTSALAMALVLSGCLDGARTNEWQMKAFWEVEFVRPDLTREVLAPPPMDVDEIAKAAAKATADKAAEKEPPTAEEQEQQWNKVSRRAAGQLFSDRVALERALVSDMLSLGLVQPHLPGDKPGVRLTYTFSRFHPRSIRISISGFFAGLLVPVPGAAFIGAYRQNPGFYRVEVHLEDCRGNLLARFGTELKGKSGAMRQLSQQLRAQVALHLDKMDSACRPRGLYFAGSLVR